MKKKSLIFSLRVFVLMMFVGITFSACDKDEYYYTTIIIPPTTGDNGNGNNGSGNNDGDISFIVDGKFVKEITIYQDILLELVPKNRFSDGYFKVWYYWAPEGIIWAPPTSGQYAGKYVNYIVHKKGTEDTFYAQYFDRITGESFSQKVALIIHHR
ncbi:MAG: hypothetical protein LBD11_04375 [Candidatus Peribacteria bacterium]|jgi:hypothetical protein|nr:hypothetical protein [Candidatus Peribacteria bacterium]